MKKIVVVGSINMDYVTHVQQQPGVGETVSGQGLDLKPGGKGANQAYAAAYLGADVTMLGAVGNDAAGRMSLDSLQHAGVHTEYIRTVEGVSTGTALIAVNAEGDNSIIVIPGANDKVDRDYVDSVMDVILASDIVILQLEIPFDTVCYVAEKAKEAGKCVILDPAPARELPEELIRGLTIVKPNQTEIMKVLGRADEACQPERELNTLKAMGVAHPIITLGSKGCCTLDAEGKLENVPAVKASAVDTTGAGDCFTGAMACSLAEGNPLEKALGFAAKASAIAVTREGAQPSFPARKEIL